MTRRDRELAALVAQAFELRGTPYLDDAAAAIADWHERRHLRELEHRQEAAGRLVRLLRATAPERITGRAA